MDTDLKRCRISQFLILPPFQRQGLGTRLLRAVTDAYIKDPACLEITVEDASEDFQAMRDLVDLGILLDAGIKNSLFSI
jgi:histone acetyltransferase 1